MDLHMARNALHLMKVFIFLFAGSEVSFIRSVAGNTDPRRRVTQPLTFLQTPQHMFVSRDQPANLTCTATNVCKVQIRCNGKQFERGEGRFCGKTCNKCKTRTRTKVISFSDFPKSVRSMTCQCKVWGTTANRTDKVIVQKAFLRRNFSAVQLNYVAFLNATVIIQCRPPGGSPPPDITWYKNGEPMFPSRGRRLRVRLKKSYDLVIKRLRRNDSGIYQCVVENMAARREGPVMTLEVRENTAFPVRNASQLLCANDSSATCSTAGSNESSRWGSRAPMLVVGTRDGFTTVNLRNRSKVARYKAKNVVSLDFGWDPDLIYWTDKKKINVLSLHSGVSEEVPFRLDLDSSVRCVAVDLAGKRLYWTDTTQGVIYLGDQRNGRKAKLIKDELDILRTIVLSPTEGYIYWTDWGRTAKIERARPDGTERTTFLTSRFHFPNALAFDKLNRTLYWAGTDENKYGVIEAVSPDGLSRNTIFYRRGYHPFSLDVYEDFVYWSDLGMNAVFRINKTDGSGVETIVDGLEEPMGLKIVYRRDPVGREGPNSCDENNGGCAHVCLLLPFLGRHKCFCEEGCELNEEKQNSGTLLVWFILFATLFVLLVFIFLALGKLKKYFVRHADPLRMLREEMGEIQEIDDEQLDNDQTDLLSAEPQLNVVPADLSQQICGPETSGPNPVNEDSPVTLQQNISLRVLYMTNLEQHNGVTILGDGATVHHHNPPQNQ